ncbi:MAG: hypothetical protein KAI63_00435, partial [Planctomycetes bacterium]|nr:hypothetical protein [Planctomycetota bacterium]
VKIQASVNGLVGPYEDIGIGSTGGFGTGQYTWTPISDTISNNVRIKVLDNDAGHPPAEEGISNQCQIKGKLILDYPKGGEPSLPWSIGNTVPITWTAQGSIATVELRYSAVVTDTLANTHVITTGLSSGAGTYSYDWTILDSDADLPSTKVKIWVINTADSTVLNKSTFFFRVKGLLQLIDPPSPQLVDDPYTIQWVKSSGITDVELEYWDGSGAGSWESIGTWPIPAGAGGSGSYNWTIANAIAPDAKLRITDANDGTVSDESDTFRINGGIDVTSPGIEIWTVGETRPISWTLNGTIPLVNIYYSTDNFATITKTIKTDASGAAEVFTWSPVTDDVTAGFNARIKVTNAADESNMQGTSQGFKVRGILTLTYPPDVDGRIYRVGQTIPINWTSNANSISQVKLFINGEGAPFQTVSSFKGSNSWDWTIPASATSDDVRIKIEDINDSDVFSVGSKYFMVKPDVKMTEPGKDPGEVYKVGTPIDIIFDFTGTDNATLKFYYNKGG